MGKTAGNKTKVKKGLRLAPAKKKGTVIRKKVPGVRKRRIIFSEKKMNEMVKSIFKNYSVVEHNNQPLSCSLVGKQNKWKYYLMEVREAKGNVYIWSKQGIKGPGIQRIKELPLQIAIGQYLGQLHSLIQKEYVFKDPLQRLPSSAPDDKITKQSEQENEEVKTKEEGDIEEQKEDQKEEQKRQTAGQNKHQKDIGIEFNDGLLALLKLIFDLQLIERGLSKSGYDIKKLPLIRLDPKRILKGNEILKILHDCLLGICRKDSLKFREEFFKCIPHDPGMVDQVKLSSKVEVQKQFQLLANLFYSHITCKIIEMNQKQDQNLYLIECYKKLNCRLESLIKVEDEHYMLGLYLNNTKGARNVTIMNSFRVVKSEEEKYYNPLHLGNKKLLWQGRRFMDYGGILSEGFHIDKSKVPQLFGKAIKFHDTFDEAAYSCDPGLSQGVGILLLCEVALGKSSAVRCVDADVEVSSQRSQSAMCKGLEIPDPADFTTVFGDVVVPQGQMIRCEDGQQRHNEYAVYDPYQVRMRYLMMVKFH